MRYTIEFAGETAEENGVLVQRRPNISTSEEVVDSHELPGRDGELITDAGIRRNVEIEVELGFRAEPDQWNQVYRSCKRWLRKKGILRLSDDSGYFRRVKRVVIGTAERETLRIGKFSVFFVCSPEEFLDSGQQRLSPKLVAYNPYSVSRPVYYITGEGECTLTVNGQRLVMDIYDNMVIDTEHWISYREYDHTVYLLAHDGSPLLTESGVPLIRSYGHPGLINDHETRGDYTDLYLQEGDNTFSVSEGFELKIMPNWRCL